MTRQGYEEMLINRSAHSRKRDGNSRLLLLVTVNPAVENILSGRAPVAGMGAEWLLLT